MFKCWIRTTSLMVASENEILDSGGVQNQATEVIEEQKYSNLFPSNTHPPRRYSRSISGDFRSVLNISLVALIHGLWLAKHLGIVRHTLERGDAPLSALFSSLPDLPNCIRRTHR